MIKVCNKCKATKSISNFHRNKKMTDGHINTCKECVKIYTRNYNLINPKKGVSKWAKNNPDKMREHRQKWVKNNKKKNIQSKKKYKSNNKEKCSKQNSEYAKANRDKCNKSTANYRAQKLKATPILNEFDSFIVEELYNLSKLRQTSTGVKMHVDHIVPLVSKKVCGLHNVHNLCVISAQANQSKNNRYWPDM